MPKAFWVFIQLILIFQIVFSSQWTTIEMKDLKSTNTQNIESYTFIPLAYFGSTNVIKIQSKFKLDNLLIYLSSDKFKYCILPYLSSHAFVKIYLHFQKLVPELNFQKFLPPSRFYTTNNVLDIQDPTAYLQPLEINLLYQFNGEYSSLKPHILYSSKTKIPIIVESHIPIHPDSICAHISQNKIIVYKFYVVPASHQELLILRNVNQFFVTFQESKNQFINIARGNIVSDKEFPDYVECIWEAYNLQGWKKNYWKLKSFLTMIYVKYLFYVFKIISCLYEGLATPLDIFSNYLEQQSTNYYNPCVDFLFGLLFILFYVPYSLMMLPTGYIVCVFWYYVNMFPFFALAFPLKHFIFGFNWHSFVFVSPGLAFLYICLFPHIKKCMPFSVGEIEHIKSEDILPNILKSFEIEPKRIMSVLPLLIRTRKLCLVECADTFILYLIIFGLGLIFSFPFWASRSYF